MEDQSATGDSEREGSEDENIDSLEDDGNEVDERDTRGEDDYDHDPPPSEDELEPSEHEEGLPAEEYSRKSPTPDTHDLSSNLRQKREDDRRKGKAILRQIVRELMWLIDLD